MYSTLRSEPVPVLKAGAPEGSSRTSDYIWGYTDDHRQQYKKAAETFYQLFKWQYGETDLTPYMMKFIDYAPLFMQESEIPLCRFKAVSK